MIEWAICILLLIGACLMLTASLGIARLPDLFTRMQASTKASSLGVSCMLIATILYFQTTEVTIRALAIIIFVFLTAPVGAHMLGRVAYILKVPFWEGTKVDELKRDLETKETKPKTQKSKSGAGVAKISDIFKKLKDKKID